MLFTQGKSPIVIASKEDAGVTVTLYLPLRREMIRSSFQW